jgi:uncharacterized membrane protein YgcG
LIVVALLATALRTPLEAAFPRPARYVNDFAAVLTADVRVYLEGFLRTVERDTTAEVVVATVTSLDGLSIIVAFLALFVGFGGFATGVGLSTKTAGPLLFGVMFSGIPLFIGGMMSPISLAALLPLELFALVVGYRKARSSDWARALRSGSPDHAGEHDRWIMGGTEPSSSGSFDGGGSSSSSSDFGGGSSGGGGASGRW